MRHSMRNSTCYGMDILRKIKISDLIPPGVCETGSCYCVDVPTHSLLSAVGGSRDILFVPVDKCYRWECDSFFYFCLDLFSEY